MGTYFKGSSPSYRNISDNIESTKNAYKLNNGYFGDKGNAKVKTKYLRQIICNDQYLEAKRFYNLIAYGGIEQKMSNGKGYITKLSDGTIITYREITSTPNSPAVEINIKNSNNSGGIKSQKIHFEKRDK